MNTNSHNARCYSKKRRAGSSMYLKKLLPLFLFAVLSFSAKIHGQVAAVNPPTGGFNIDGILQASTDPYGDWLQGTSTGGFVLNDDGSPVNPLKSFFLTDLYNSSGDDVFKDGAMANDPISALHWQLKKAVGKDDIGHGLFHITKDADNNTWLMLASDRFTSGSSSYVDFELLQNSLTMNNDVDKTFTGGGPADGRTVNDLLITVSYSGGGGGNFNFFKWEPSGGGFDWIEFFPSGTPIASLNSTTINAPYGAFGSFTYDADQFIEGAVNVTAVINSSAGGGCPPGIAVSTIWIKTKTSGTGSGSLKDFMAPFDFSVNIGKPTTTGGKRCGPGDVPLSATADGSGYTLTWYSDAALTNQVATGNTYTPNLTETTTFYVTQTLTQGNCQSAATAVTATVGAVPTADAVGTDAACFGGNSGSVDLTVSGGAPGGYTFAWTKENDNDFAASTEDLNNVTAGTYNVLITDAGGCTTTASAVVGEPELALTASAEEGTIKCHDDQTTVTITASGGTAPYTNDGEHTVSAGPYSFIVSDAHGCTYTVEGNISAPDALTASAEEGTINCNGGTTTVTITASGGTVPYTNDGEHTVSAGPYSFIVSDAGGCTYTVEGNITEPDALTASASGTDVRCNGESNGSVNLTPGGGTLNYTFVWTKDGDAGFSATSEDLTNVFAGTYHVTVTDHNGCTKTASATVGQPGVLSCSAVQVSTRGCSTTVNDGSATVTAIGGNGGYQYLWDDSETGATATQLSAGNHSVTVTDAKGCTTGCSVTIAQRVCSGIYPTQTSCAGYNSGTIEFLPKVCLTIGKKGSIYSVTNGTPGVFFYYTKITVPNNNYTVYIKQTKCAAVSKAFADMKGQILAYTNSCGKIASGTAVTGLPGDATITIKNQAGNEVIIGIKYDVKSIIGATVPAGFTTCTYTFETRVGNIAGAVLPNTAVNLLVGKCVGGVIAQSSTQSSSLLTSGDNSALKVRAYPNPYTTEISFRFMSPVSGPATLEIYTELGQRLAVINKGKIDAGIEQNVTYKVPASNRVTLMYKLTVGTETFRGMVVPDK